MPTVSASILDDMYALKLLRQYLKPSGGSLSNSDLRLFLACNRRAYGFEMEISNCVLTYSCWN